MVFDLVALQQFMHCRFGIAPAKIHLGSELVADLGLDELDRIELMLYLEDGYGVEFPEESLNRYETVLELIVFTAFTASNPLLPAHGWPFS